MLKLEATVLIVIFVSFFLGCLTGNTVSQAEFCREAGYYNTLEACENVTYERESE